MRFNNMFDLFDNISRFERVQLKCICDEKTSMNWYYADTVSEVLNLEIEDITKILFDSEIRDISSFNFSPSELLYKSESNLMISEPGLLRCILSSKTFEAMRFQNKLFYEILPILIRLNSYIDPETIASIQSDNTNKVITTLIEKINKFEELGNSNVCIELKPEIEQVLKAAGFYRVERCSCKECSKTEKDSDIKSEKQRCEKCGKMEKDSDVKSEKQRTLPTKEELDTIIKIGKMKRQQEQQNIYQHDIDIKDMADILSSCGYKVDEDQLRKELEEDGFLFGSGFFKSLPSANKVQDGLMKVVVNYEFMLQLLHKYVHYPHNPDLNKIYEVMITPKGIESLVNHFTSKLNNKMKQQQNTCQHDVNIKDMADILSSCGYKVDKDQLCKELKDDGFLFDGAFKNMPYENVIQAGLMKVDINYGLLQYKYITHMDNPDQVNSARYHEVMITPKGIEFFVNHFTSKLNNKK